MPSLYVSLHVLMHVGSYCVCVQKPWLFGNGGDRPDPVGLDDSRARELLQKCCADGDVTTTKSAAG